MNFGLLFVNAQPANIQNVTSTPTPSYSGSESGGKLKLNKSINQSDIYLEVEK